MEKFEKVEKLREKTGVSYEEAKKVLEQTNYDMLDAIIELEKQGKVVEPKEGSYTTGANQDMEYIKKFELAQRQYEKDCKKNNVKELFRNIAEFFRLIFRKSLEIYFNINRNGKKLASVPVLVLAFMVLGFFWVTVPLIIIGLFFGVSYSFTGADKVVADMNNVCDKAAQTAETIKNEFKKDDEQN